MNQVTINRLDLLTEVTANANLHKHEYLEAMMLYRREAIAEIQAMLKAALEGGEIPRRLTLPEPDDHTKEYERLIAMLTRSVDGTITLTAHDFDRYVLDNWEWKEEFTKMHLGYKSREIRSL